MQYLLIPETEVKIYGVRYLRIEEVPSPFHSGFTNHGRQMISGKALHTLELFVTESKNGIAGQRNRFRGTIQIDVGLHAKSRNSRVTGPLCEAFENQVLCTGP